MNPLTIATSTVVDLNQKSQSLGDCLKEINNFGQTVYQNVCTGQQVAVPWGSADWVGAVFIISLGLLVLVVVVVLICMAISDL